MDDAIVWLIIAAFYAPLHFAGPIGVVVLTTREVSNRQRLMRYMLIESGLTMLAAFSLVIWLVADNLKMAMLILFLSMLLPYLFLLIHRHLILRQAS